MEATRLLKAFSTLQSQLPFTSVPFAATAPPIGECITTILDVKNTMVNDR